MCNTNCDPPYKDQDCGGIDADSLEGLDGYYTSSGYAMSTLSNNHFPNNVSGWAIVATPADLNSTAKSRASIAITTDITAPESAQSSVAVPLTATIHTTTDPTDPTESAASCPRFNADGQGCDSVFFDSGCTTLSKGICTSAVTISNLLHPDCPVTRTWPKQTNSRFTKVAMSGPVLKPTNTLKNNTVTDGVWLNFTVTSTIWVTLTVTATDFQTVGRPAGEITRDERTMPHLGRSSINHVGRLGIAARTMMIGAHSLRNET
ncbi:hypothetical protein BD289DRAFT_203847 [Coniella lustricola]|uniref:Uncharacterized protein n=1 Tax=Coniella lustricola TaxID=2025994 RepID=A0A2T3ACC4_9PEZI|nr:hypothetical protein BD289DRAFT_203847 [Coniella lustricola]